MLDADQCVQTELRNQNSEWFIQPQQQVIISLKNCQWHNTVDIRKVKETAAKALINAVITGLPYGY